ncbi:DUF5753 domain-containing protein [Thermomonospora amylolytica]|uniref:DUF5753 domain-containing protein n=1 Tax=Thermomonospora amylolytica TaxID=1411117 RepID=UPI000E6CAD1E|nr:DUF5753 domain-containing protein [Thermomonospora amylolytica]
MAKQGPTVRQRQVARVLRELRERRQLSQGTAAGLLGWDRTKLVKLETADRIPTVADVEKIVEAYGDADQAVTLALLQLTREVRQRGWWVPFTDVLSGAYAELEHAAARIRMFQAQLVPGLLQTEGYARTLIAGDHPGLPDAEVDRRVQVRMTRRAMLSRQDPPRLEVVLAEEVLRRPIGGREVMRAQLAALLAACEHPHMSIRIIPIERGHYQSIGAGNLIVFEFSSIIETPVAYMDSAAGGRYEENLAQVQLCTVKFERIAEAALSEGDSAAKIRTVIKEM